MNRNCLKFLRNVDSVVLNNYYVLRGFGIIKTMEKLTQFDENHIK